MPSEELFSEITQSKTVHRYRKVMYGESVSIRKGDNGFYFIEYDDMDASFTINENFVLEDASFLYPLVIRGKLIKASVSRSNKYAKDITTDVWYKFFTYKGIPVMKASLVVIQGSQIKAKGIT